MFYTLIDLTGQRFGKWIVLKQAPTGKHRETRWYCRCDCGKERNIDGDSLRRGQSKGCRSCHTSRRNTMNIKHGQTKTRLYGIRRGMISRCENPNEPAYKNYGGRGIKICPEWRKDFTAFRKWALEHGYKDNLTIDRINNDGNYEPENCHFIIKAAQYRNTRNNRLVRIGNETKSLAEWAEETGINYSTLRARVRRNCPEHRLLNR